MAKKAVKKEKRENTFKESQVLVMLEKMDDKITLLAEGQMDMRETMDKKFDILFEFKENTERDLAVLLGFKSNAERDLATLLGFKDSAEKNFAIIMEYLERIDDDVQIIKKRLDEMDEKKMDRKEYNFIMKRVDDLEKEVKNLAGLVKTKTALAK